MHISGCFQKNQHAIYNYELGVHVWFDLRRLGGHSEERLPGIHLNRGVEVYRHSSQSPYIVKHMSHSSLELAVALTCWTKSSVKLLTIYAGNFSL